jgi:GNAT superfamily N-acetyltransferase
MELVASLDKTIFPYDYRVDTEGAVWWLVYKDGEAVAFAGIANTKAYWFLRRAGVLEGHRGKGLQKRLIKTRVRYAKKHAPELGIYTYTDLENHPSSNSLISIGFKLYDPATKYAGRALYWGLHPDNRGR